MSVENIIKLREAIATSPELQARYQAIRGATKEEVAEKTAALSIEAGTPFTAEELLANVVSPDEEISAEQLESVAGGSGDGMDAGGVFSTIFLSRDLDCLKRR